jgi:hypothetical protein|tara:strand:+ start:53 stop:163 length:111 start_codon:yes stop_codon:yes gene_type:complete
MTRAKKGLHLIEDVNRPSIFTQELKRKEYKEFISVL